MRISAGKNHACVLEFVPKTGRMALEFEDDRLHCSPHDGLLGRAAQMCVGSH